MKEKSTELVITKVSQSNNVSTIDGQRINMYTVAQGKGNKRVSHTRHMTEPQAESLRKSLGGK